VEQAFADVFYFQSRYDDFIAAQNIYQPISGRRPTYQPLEYADVRGNFNNFNEIFVDGWGSG
jgi:hypothetical protein